MKPPASIDTLSVIDLAEAIRLRDVTAAEACDAYLERIAVLDPTLNAYASVLAGPARDAATRADLALDRGLPVGSLHGVPIAVKDLFAVEGQPTLAGSVLREGNPPARQDAVALARLRSAGAILLGTLKMDEFAAGLCTEHTYGPPTRNPWDLERIAGGSSGGSAVAVAAGLAAATLGTDTNGSIRVPASLCGVVGFKPTYGRIPTTGVTPLSWSLDHVGPLARSVGDASLLYRVMAGEPPVDEAASPGEQVFDGLRVGILPDSALRRCSPSVVRAFQDVIESIAERVRLVEVDTPALEWSGPAAGIITAVEAATYHYADLRARPLAFHRGIRSELRAAALLPASAYVRAQRVRGMVRDRFARVFEAIDVLLVPTTPVTALRRGDVEGRKVLGDFTQPFSFAGLPALSVPINLPAERLPVGLTIAGPAFEDDLVLRVGIALEAIGAVRTGRPTIDPIVLAPAIS